MTIWLGALCNLKGSQSPATTCRSVKPLVNTLYTVHSGRTLATGLPGHLITCKATWRYILANRYCTVLRSGTTAIVMAQCTKETLFAALLTPLLPHHCSAPLPDVARNYTLPTETPINTDTNTGLLMNVAGFIKELLCAGK